MSASDRPDGPADAPRDAFGNEIDPIVGYARGTILSTDAAFHRKIRHAHSLIRARAADGGAFHVLTGNRADFPLGPDDLGLGCDGWVGPAVYGPRLTALAREHLGADDTSDVALFNRTSAGVIAAVAALVPPGGLVASLVPRGRAHPCVRRGARLAGATVVEGPSLAALTDDAGRPQARPRDPHAGHQRAGRLRGRRALPGRARVPRAGHHHPG